MTNTLKLGDTTVSRVIAIATAVATVVALSGVAVFAGALQANAAGHQNLANGSLIRAEGSIDVYIFDRVGEKTFRRLILNPEVFNSYGHLNWGDIQDVPAAVVSAPTVTDLVMESRDDGSVVTGDVYQVVPQNDTGTKHHLQMTPAEFEAEGYDWDAIRRINNLEFNLYATGAAITADGEAPPEEGTTNTEGTMTVKRAVNPGNVDFQPGDTAAVLGFSVKAEESSLNFQRVDVTLDVTSGAQSLQNTLDTISLYRGSTLLATEAVSNANFTDNPQDGDEIIRLDGFSDLIGLDQEVSYEIRVTATADDSLAFDQVIDVNVDFDAGSGGATLRAIRAVDSAGIQQYGGTASGRTFTVEAAEDAALALTTSANDPDERLVLADDDTTTEDVEVLRFGLEATDGDVLLTDLVVTTTVAGEAGGAYDNFSYVRLYDGAGTLVGEESAAATVTFADIAVNLTKDVKQDFRVDVGLRDWTGENQAVTLSASVSSSDMTAEDSDGDAVVPTGGQVEGENINIYSQAPDLTFVSASISQTGDNETLASGHITFDVKAHGSDIYVQVEDNASESATGTLADSTATSTTWAWDLGSETAVSGTEADGVFLISEGTTVQFRVNVALNNTGGTAGFKRAFVEQVAWDTDSNVDAGGTIWDNVNELWAVEDLETDTINLQSADV